MKYFDFHSHILPGVDHGSDSLETSLTQLKLAKEAGVAAIHASSHFYPHMHNVESFLKKRQSAYEQLMDATSEDSPQILLGAEVLLCEGLERLPGIKELCIANTNTMLLELPFTEIKRSYIETVENLLADGINIVLAHADRYSREDVERFLLEGASIQLNASALSGFLIPKAAKAWIAKDSLVVALGSDIHGADASAYKKFTRAIAKLGKNAETIMNASKTILNYE